MAKNFISINAVSRVHEYVRFVSVSQNFVTQSFPLHNTRDIKERDMKLAVT